jgi:hypothetical protein
VRASGLSYVLPILRQPGADPRELTDYLRWLADRAEVIVVDGSDPAVFAENRSLWAGFAVHTPPDPVHRTGNGKVGGVHTGIDAASHERVVIADDDVRYDDAGLAAMEAALGGADLVRPQNHFEPMPWHARWDTARSLLNRCFGADSPGTLGVRREFFEQMGGYDGDVLYENLELVRTVEAAGGTVTDRPDIYVRRVPPTTRRFLEQRPRQAYDDFAQPWKLVLFLALGPASALAVRSAAGRRRLAVGAASVIAMAEIGRRKADGKQIFPGTAALWAPAWVAERAFCSWWAVQARMVKGGAAYGGGCLRVAAHSVRWLRRERGAVPPPVPDVAPVAQGRLAGASTPA